ncbi:MAG: efflux RND transporter periplasmic adaptor subunit [Elusimicrobia bacterium]|nr:efflux RND transporter periplasmic adaptor subunit [Elusimicrobiota bacterium]
MFKKQLFFILSLMLVVTIMIGCSKKESQEQSAAEQAAAYSPLVNATKAINLDIPWDQEYPAQVAGSLEVEVRAQVGGILKERLYNEGQFVEKDTVLFTIDPQEYQIALERAQASLEQVNTQVQKAQRDFYRMKELIKDNAVSQKDYDDSLSAYERTQADYKAAKAVVDDAKRNLGYAKVKAPIAGIARKENHSVGSLISLMGDDSLLTTMVQINPLHINFSIPGKQLAQLKDGVEQDRLSLNDDVVVDVLIGNKVYPYSGKIIFFDSAEDLQTSAYSVKVEVENPEDRRGDLNPGQFVKVRIKGIIFKNAVLIPQNALIESPNGPIVYVINTSSNNVVDAVPVSAELKGSIAVVYDGLKGDETVISGGSLKVMPGIPVKFELKNIDLPEEFKQAYVEKYGQEPPQDGVQQEQGQQEENQNQEGQTENNEQQQTSEQNNEQQAQKQDNNNEQQTQQQDQAQNNEQK